MAATLVNILMASGGRKGRESDLPVFNAQGLQSEDIATPTVSTASTITASRAGEVCRISPVGGDVYAAFGADPTAAAGDVLIFAGTSFEIALERGHKVAVIDR